MSGTFGSYILLTQPNTFKNYIIGAPAPLLNGQFIHEYTPVLKMTSESLDANVFVAVGSDDKAQYTNNAFSLVRFFKSKKTEKLNIELKVIESAGHSVAFPMSAMQSLYWLADISQ